MKLSEEDKREIIRLNREVGVPKSELARIYNVGIEHIKGLFRRYDLHGEETLVKGPNRKYSPEFKMEVIKQYMEGEPINSLAIANNIRWTMIDSWIKRYEKDGYNGLVDKKRGRPPKMKKDRDKIDQTVTKTAEEAKDDGADKARIKLLEKKNRELEAEVAYLKKLNALVQERKKRESKKK